MICVPPSFTVTMGVFRIETRAKDSYQVGPGAHDYIQPLYHIEVNYINARLKVLSSLNSSN